MFRRRITHVSNSAGWWGAIYLTGVIALLLQPGCQAGAGSGVESVESKPFSLESVMKSDLDMLVEIHQQQTLGYLEELTEKLYRRNPRELRKQPGATISGRRQQLFALVADAGTVGQSGSGVELLGQAFEESYQGDRVLVLITGLRDMVMSAYNEQRSFNFLDAPLDPQKFYNSARNVEILLWRLSHERRSNGKPWLLTNALGPQVNISYERLFGKLIGQLDIMAQMVAHQRNIQIKNLMRSVASAVFLPV